MAYLSYWVLKLRKKIKLIPITVSKDIIIQFKRGGGIGVKRGQSKITHRALILKLPDVERMT